MKSKKNLFTKEAIRAIFSEWGFSRSGFLTNKNGEWWLMVQLALIIAHLSPPIAINLIFSSYILLSIKTTAVLLLIVGIYIGLIALISLGKNLSPLPQPKDNAVLVTNRIYQYSRHPLYLSLIIISTSINLFLLSFSHLFLLLALCLTLVGKAHSEERRLKHVYSDYKSYMKRTPAILKGLPFFDWRT